MKSEFIEELKRFIGGDDNAKRDLFALALANDEHVAGEFEKLWIGLTELEGKTLSELMAILQSWSLSMNLTERKVFWVCKNKRMCTTYDMVEDTFEIDGNGVEDAFKEECKTYLPRRINFNRIIKNEEYLKYTALNIGNLGLRKFGNFCFLFENATAGNLESIAFIKGNSLDAYSDENDNLDIERLTKEISSKKYVKELVIIKYNAEIKKTPKEDWPDTVCCTNSYVEGIVFDELKLDYVALVKISNEYHDQFNKAALDIRYGEAVPSVTGDFTARYFSALDALNAAGINVKIT